MRDMTIPIRRARVWASSVGGDTAITGATQITPVVIGVGGTLVVSELQADNSTVANFTWTAAELVAMGGTISGRFVSVIASGSSGIYGLLVEW